MRVWVIVGVVSALVGVVAPAAAAEGAQSEGARSIEAVRPADRRWRWRSSDHRRLFETGALRRHGERRRRLAVDVPRRR